MYGIEKRKKSIFFSFHTKVFRRKTEKDRRSKEEEIRQHLPIPAFSSQSGLEVVQFSLPGPQSVAPGSPHSLKVLRAGHWAGYRVALGGEEGDWALEFEGDRGGWGQGLPSLGPSLHPGNPSLWEERASGLCLKHLGEDAQGAAGAGWSYPRAALEPTVPFTSVLLPFPAIARCSGRHTPLESCFQTRILYSRESGLAVKQPRGGSLLHVQPGATLGLCPWEGQDGDALAVKNNVPAQAVARCEARPRGQGAAKAPRQPLFSRAERSDLQG